MVKPDSTVHDSHDTAFSQSVNLVEALKKLNPHDHLCLVYDTEEEWYSAIITFIALGLERNEKCIYVVDTHTANQICDYLREEGINVDAVEASGQLVILHETEAYTRDGVFDPDKMIALLAEETKKAISEGYSALRVTGEMSWALRGHPGSEAIIEYEAKLNMDFFPHYPCLAICQYYRRLFDPRIIRHVIMTHPLMVRNNTIYYNPYYIPPEEFLSNKRNHYELEHLLEDLEHQSLVAEIIRRSEELEALNKISFTIAQSPKLEDVLSAALEKTLEVLDVEGGIIYVLDEPGQTFLPSIHRGVSQKVIDEVLGFKKGEGLSQRAAQTGNPILASDLAENPWNISPVLGAEGWQSLMCVPLKVENSLKGVLTVISRVKARFRPDDLNLLISIGNQISIAIENAQLYKARQQELKERTRAEEELRKSEKKYRDLVENINDVIYACDTQGVLTYVSPAIEPLTGYDPSEIIGRTFADFIYKEDTKYTTEMFCSIMSGNSCPYECRIVTKSGDIRWICSFGRPIFENDSIKGVQGVLTDITDRKKAEEAIRESEEKYRTFVQNLRGIAFRGNMNWTPLFFHGTVKEITGYSEEEFLRGTPRWDEIIHPDDMPTLQESARNVAVIPDYSTTREYRIIRKDQKVRWVQEFIQNICDDSSTPLYVQGVIYDITEQKRAEEEVMQLSTAVEMSSDCIIISDMDGNITDVNEAALKMYRTQKREDFVGKSVKEVVVPEDFKKVLTSVKEVIEKGCSKSIECDLIVKDGTRVTVETSMGIIRAGGSPRGIVSISRDITERKQAEKELKKKLMKYDLEEGFMYLIQERTPCTSLEALQDLLTVGYPGLAFSRTPKREFKDKVELDIDHFWIAERGDEPFIPPDLKEIQNKIEMLNRPTALFIDRLDYLISKTSFKEILTFVQVLREIVYLKQHIVVLSIDPSTLTVQELRQIEKETSSVEPLYKTKLPEELVDVLRTVYELNVKGMKPSYTRVGRETGASKPTARKRIRTLINYGYLKESKKGRTKVVDLTEKGRLFFL
ncbi:MAG: PAS domain S-box protein [Theionarchaea archaeon]|nr:PAS domain S-box protein [Theionarchaea archaeon]